MESLEAQENKQETFEDTFQVAEESLGKSLMQLIKGEHIDLYNLLDIVDTIAAKADNDVNLFDMLFTMNRTSDSLYRHLLSVSIYAQLLAKWMD